MDNVYSLKDPGLVPKLGKGGEHFSHWRMMLEQTSRSMGLYYYLTLDMKPEQVDPSAEKYDLKTKAGREQYFAADKEFKDWDQEDSKLRAIILRTAPDDLTVQLDTKTSAKDMYDYILDRYANDGPSQLAIVVQNFVTLRWDGRSDLTRFLDKWSAALTATERLNVTWDKTVLFIFLLLAVDQNTGNNDRFRDWAEYTRRQLGDKDAVTKLELNYLIRELNDRYAGKRHDQQAHSHFANANRGKKANTNDNKPSKKNPDGSTCFVCDSAYHMSRQCPHLHPDLATNPNFKPNTKLVEAYKKRAKAKNDEKAKAGSDNNGKKDDTVKSFSMAASDYMCARAALPTTAWIVDSGASHHYSNDRSAFTDFTAEHGLIGCGGGQVPYEGVGRVHLISYDCNGDRVSSTFSGALYTPTLPVNTISPGQLKQYGVFWEGKPEALQKDGKDVLYAPLHDLFRLNIIDIAAIGDEAKTMLLSTALPVEPAHVAQSHTDLPAAVDTDPKPAATAPLKLIDINALHRRLGHAWWDLCRSYAISHGLKPTGQEQDCETCLLTKSERAPGHQPQQRETDPLACLHGDTQEIKPAGLKGERYVLCLTDDATGRRWAKAVKSKSDIYSEVEHYLEFCHHQFGRYPRRIRMDMGREFAPKQFSLLCKTKGIIWEPSAEYYPEQNGKAEKANHIIQTRVRAMIKGAKAPLFLWSEALPTVVKMLNDTPTRLNGMKSPDDVFFARLNLPQLRHTTHHFREWGSVAYVNIPKQKRVRAEKLADTALKGRLVGYEGNHIVRVFIAPNSIIRSPAVKVLEGVFEDDKQIDQAVIEAIVIDRADFAPNQLPADESEHEHHQEEATATESQGVLPPPPEEDELYPHEAPPDVDLQSDMSVYEDVPEIPTLGAVDNADIATHAAPEPAPRRSARTTKGKHSERFIEQLSREVNQRRNLLAFCTLHYCFAAAMGFAPKINDLPPVPRTWKQMVQHPLSKEFLAATRKEMEQHARNGTYRKVRKPTRNEIADVLLLPVKWVWDYKKDADGRLASYKARLVVRGDKQRPGLDYLQTYAATVRPATLKLLLALAAVNAWIVDQDDVLTAFLNGKMDRTGVFIKLPEGYREYDVDGTEMVGELLKALYGLKQAPLLWNTEFTGYMKSLAYTPLEADPCLFKTPHGGHLIIYVDDLLYIHPNRNGIDAMKRDVRSRYDTRDLGALQHYLGMRVQRDHAAKKIYLSQDAYVASIMDTYKVIGMKENPLPAKEKLVPNDGPFDPERTARFQSIIGSIGYAANLTRPDVAFAAHRLCQYSSNPSDRHMQLAEHLLQYLNGHRDLAICLGGKSLNIRGYSDAAHADNKDRRSTAGFVFLAAGGVLSYKSHKQTVVATSTTYAEYIALASAAKEAIWIQKLLAQLSYNKDLLASSKARPMTLFGDNNSSLAIANADRNSNRTKHFDIVYHFTRECIDSGDITVQYVPTADMVADGLTKALEPTKHAAFIKQLGLVPRLHDHGN